MYFFVASIYAQTPTPQPKPAGFIGINTTNPKALLDVSNTPGFQIPRVTRAERLSLTAPSHGTLVFDTTVGCMASWNENENNGSGGWLFLCGDSIEPFLSCKDLDIFYGSTITPEMLVDQLDYGLLSEGLEIKLKENSDWYENLVINCEDAEKKIFIDLKESHYLRSNINTGDEDNVEFFPMRRFNNDNSTKIDNPAPNKTAVKGQPWMTAIEFYRNNNNSNKQILWSQRRQKSNTSERIEIFLKDNKIHFFYGVDGGDEPRFLKWSSNETISSKSWQTITTIYDGGETGGNNGTLADFFSRFKFYKTTTTNQITEISGTWSDGDTGGYNKNIGGFLWIGGWKQKNRNGIEYDAESLADIKFSKFSCITLNVNSTLPSNNEIQLFSKNPKNYEATYLNGKDRRLPHVINDNSHTYDATDPNKTSEIKIFKYYLLEQTNNLQSLRNQVHYADTPSNKKTWLYLYPEENLVIDSWHELLANIRFKNDHSISCESTIRILERANPTLTYNNIGNANTTAEQSMGGSLTPIVSPLGGKFSSTPTGLDLDATTGIINVSNSCPGTYQVTYQSSCNKSVSHEVIINGQEISITCPDTINAETAGNDDIIIEIDEPIYTGTDIMGIRNDGKNLGDPFPIGTTTITWKVLNSCGETVDDSCTQDVIIEEGCAIKTNRQYSYAFNDTYLKGENINNAYFANTNGKWATHIIFKSNSSNKQQTLWSIGNQRTQGQFILYYKNNLIHFEIIKRERRGYTGILFKSNNNLIKSGDWNSLIIEYDGLKKDTSFKFYTINLNDQSLLDVTEYFYMSKSGNYNNINPGNAFNVGKDLLNNGNKNNYFYGNIASLSFTKLIGINDEKALKKFALNPKCWLNEVNDEDRNNTNIYLMGDHNSGITNSIINQSEPNNPEFRLNGTAKKEDHGDDIY